jgi:hypothetical protein
LIQVPVTRKASRGLPHPAVRFCAPEQAAERNKKFLYMIGLRGKTAQTEQKVPLFAPKEAPKGFLQPIEEIFLPLWPILTAFASDSGTFCSVCRSPRTGVNAPLFFLRAERRQSMTAGNGAATVQQRHRNGAATAQQRHRNGAAMVQQRRSNGTATAQKRHRNGAATAQQWCSNGTATAQKRHSNGTATAQQRNRNGTATAQQRHSNSAATLRRSLPSGYRATALFAKHEAKLICFSCFFKVTGLHKIYTGGIPKTGDDFPMKALKPLQAVKSFLFGIMMAFVSIGALPFLVIKSFTETFLP